MLLQSAIYIFWLQKSRAKSRSTSIHYNHVTSKNFFFDLYFSSNCYNFRNGRLKERFESWSIVKFIKIIVKFKLHRCESYSKQARNVTKPFKPKISSILLHDCEIRCFNLLAGIFRESWQNIFSGGKSDLIFRNYVAGTIFFVLASCFE